MRSGARAGQGIVPIIRWPEAFAEGASYDLSIITVFFNEQASVEALYRKIRAASIALGMNTEIVFIDDGSADGSFEKLKGAIRGDPDARIVRFAVNHGQYKGIETAFREARGDLIITMDGDLQNDPADLPLFVQKIGEGYDVVCGWRWQRKDPWRKRWKSIIGNLCQRAITGLPLHDLGCAFRAYRRDIVSGIVLAHKHEVGIVPLILAERTDKITEIKVRHSKRMSGRSAFKFFDTAWGATFEYFRFVLRRKRTGFFKKS